MRSFINKSHRPSQRLSYCVSFFAALLLMQGCLLSVQAAPGDLDASFGTGGSVITKFFDGDDIARSLVIQPDGKLVAVGYTATGSVGYDFALARYNANGTLDTSFGTGGKVITKFADTNDMAFASAIQSDGKIIAAGISRPFSSSIHSSFALARYNSDGSLDNSFGSGGKITTPLGDIYDSSCNAIALQRDGKIVVAGSSYTSTNNFALVRYNVNGSLDTTFGTNGIVITPFYTGSVASAVLIQPDDRIVAVGSAGLAYALARYNPDGSLDNSFGTGGQISTQVATPSPDFDAANSAVLQPDGKIIAAGQSTYSFGLTRYNANGTLDTSFGTGGKVTTSFGSGSAIGRAVCLQPNGKIVLAGNFVANNSKVALARYNPDGSLDASFGAGGKVTTQFASTAIAYAVAIQPDGQIVVAGTTTKFLIARYLGDSSFPILLTEANTTQAIALDSVTTQRGPFSVINPNNFSADQRTRISLFVWNIALPTGDNSATITAQAEDSLHRIYPLTVEYAGTTRNLYWLSQVTIKLPDELAGAGDVFISVAWHGTQSNKASINIH